MGRTRPGHSLRGSWVLVFALGTVITHTHNHTKLRFISFPLYSDHKWVLPEERKTSLPSLSTNHIFVTSDKKELKKLSVSRCDYQMAISGWLQKRYWMPCRVATQAENPTASCSRHTRRPHQLLITQPGCVCVCVYYRIFKSCKIAGRGSPQGHKPKIGIALNVRNSEISALWDFETNLHLSCLIPTAPLSYSLLKLKLPVLIHFIACVPHL